MKTYELKITHTLVNEGPAVLCCAADKAVAYMAGAFEQYPEQEQFWVILLNRKNYAKGRQLITLGTLTAALAHPREVFRAAILSAASAIICVHNHPSGDPSPSAGDVAITRQLREAGKVVDIQVLDHVIIGTVNEDPMGKGFYSFRDAGLL